MEQMLVEQERNAADMIFVAMRQQQAANFVCILLQVGEIGSDNINTQKFRFGKHHARIDDDNVIAVADCHGVHSELTKATKGDDL